MVAQVIQKHDLVLEDVKTKIHQVLIGAYDVNIQGKLVKILKLRNPFLNYCNIRNLVACKHAIFQPLLPI